MKRTSLPANCLRTESTTWTTGPQVRLEQNSGVANVTTKGTFAAIASFTDDWSRARSGGLEVEILRASATVLAVGLSDGIARSPTVGAIVDPLTTMLPSAWIFFDASTGSASSQ